MMKYRVEITEKLSRTIETEAENEEAAIEKVRQMYRNCDIILDASDYIETVISVKKWKSRGGTLVLSKEMLNFATAYCSLRALANFVELDSSI